MDLDELQEKLGGISKYQVALIAIVSILPIGTSIMSQTAVIFSAVPGHRCSIPSIDDNEEYSEIEKNNLTSMFIPPGESCKRYAYNISDCIWNGTISCNADVVNDTMLCDYGYAYDDTYFKETTVSEWNLVCQHVTLDSVANSVYFVGVFLGSAMIGPMMDWWGRKVSMLITCIGTILSGIGVALAPSYPVYIVMRVLSSMMSIPCYIAFYTYVNEISYVKWRTATATYANVVSAIGHTIVPLAAYFLRDWRHFGICVSLVSTPFLVIYWFVPRSPRWLLAKGRYEEAKEIISRYARSGNRTLGEEDWNKVVKTETKKAEEAGRGKRYVIPDLYRAPLMRMVSINVVYLWFAICMVFYGLVLNVGKLAGDPYTNATLNAIVEILSFIVFLIAVRLVGMRKTICFAYSLSGLCCLSAMFLSQFANGNQAMKEASRWVAIFGKLFSSLAWTTIYQYTAELYPTVARGTAMSMGSMSARVGSIIMPFTLQLQYTVPWLTQTIFGVLTIVGGASSLLLPETCKSDLTTSIKEAENFYRRGMKFTVRIMGTPPDFDDSESVIEEESKDDQQTMI